MRLHRHDELVEAMQAALEACYDDGGDDDQAAAAALDALLEAAMRLEVGRKCVAYKADDTWDANTIYTGTNGEGDDFPALILRMEASNDNA